MGGRAIIIILALLVLRASGATNSAVLPENPGLDGGAGGHWGKQAEPDWVDNRWNQMDVGPFVSSSLKLPNGTVAKGLSIRIGDKGEAAVCFDTASATLRAGWTGDFLKFDPARYGLINMPKIAGEIQFVSPPTRAWGDAQVDYLGFYQNGRRLTLSYRVAETAVLESPWFAPGGVFIWDFQIAPHTDEKNLALVAEPHGSVRITLARDSAAKLISINHALGLMIPSNSETQRIRLLLSSRGASPPEELPEPGPLLALGTTLWPDRIKVQGQLAVQPGAYVIDTIPVPYTNSHKALMFLSGVDFFENGDAAVCTLHGDVWLVRGIDDRLKNVTWKRFATGLFQPLGLKIVHNRVFVLGRDQITRLEDRNGDDEADFYESFHNQIRTSTSGHDYVTSLEVDREGNFYYVDPLGAHRVSADGKSSEILATGFRNPNGMSVGPNGEITVAPQEGEWTPASMICEINRGGHYGYGGPRITSERPLGYDAPLCYVPRWIDNSTGSQIWANGDKWGPLAGQLLSLSFGRCSMMLILRDLVDDVHQGAVVPLPGRFLSGAVRAAFRKQDGQLYVVGTRGWTSNAIRDGSFQRVRYTGAKIYVPLEFHAHQNGIRLRFSQPLDRRTVEDVGSYGIEQWNYHYGKEYGSREYSANSPNLIGHDPVELASATLLADEQTVFLRIPSLRPVMQMQIKYNLKAKDGSNFRGELFPTIHKLASPFSSGLAQQ